MARIQQSNLVICENHKPKEVKWSFSTPVNIEITFLRTTSAQLRACSCFPPTSKHWAKLDKISIFCGSIMWAKTPTLSKLTWFYRYKIQWSTNHKHLFFQLFYISLSLLLNRKDKMNYQISAPSNYLYYGMWADKLCWIY